MKFFAHGKKIKPAKIVAFCLLGVILLFIVIVLGTLLVKKYIVKTPVPTFAGVGCLIVVTGSMTGTINEGDMIIVKRADEFKLGDIVTFIKTDTNEAVTHRIVNYGDEEGTFITKGDYNDGLDLNPVSIDQIAGKVVAVIPKVGLAVKWFLYEGGIIYAVAIIAIIAVGVYFWNSLKKESEEDKQDSDKSAEEDKQSSDKPGEVPQDEIKAQSSDESREMPRSEAEAQGAGESGETPQGEVNSNN